MAEVGGLLGFVVAEVAEAAFAVLFWGNVWQAVADQAAFSFLGPLTGALLSYELLRSVVTGQPTISPDLTVLLDVDNYLAIDFGDAVFSALAYEAAALGTASMIDAARATSAGLAASNTTGNFTTANNGSSLNTTSAIPQWTAVGAALEATFDCGNAQLRAAVAASFLASLNGAAGIAPSLLGVPAPAAEASAASITTDGCAGNVRGVIVASVAAETAWALFGLQQMASSRSGRALLGAGAPAPPPEPAATRNLYVAVAGTTRAAFAAALNGSGAPTVLQTAVQSILAGVGVGPDNVSLGVPTIRLAAAGDAGEAASPLAMAALLSTALGQSMQPPAPVDGSTPPNAAGALKASAAASPAPWFAVGASMAAQFDCRNATLRAAVGAALLASLDGALDVTPVLAGAAAISADGCAGKAGAGAASAGAPCSRPPLLRPSTCTPPWPARRAR